jgi:beta-aspartyl-peptidase (threonine type)
MTALLLSFSLAVAVDAKADIRTVIADQATSWNKGDLDGYMAGYWKSDSLSFSSGGTHTTGWQAVYDRYKARYFAPGKERGTLTFRKLEVELLGTDCAYVKGHWHVKMTTGESEGLFTLIVKKIDGSWKVVHDHTSLKETK